MGSELPPGPGQGLLGEEVGEEGLGGHHPQGLQEGEEEAQEVEGEGRGGAEEGEEGQGEPSLAQGGQEEEPSPGPPVGQMPPVEGEEGLGQEAEGQG